MVAKLMQLLRHHKKDFKSINASANSIKLRQLANRSFNLHLATKNLFGHEKYFHIFLTVCYIDN